MNELEKKILIKAASFCAYQERTIKEVRQRLRDWQLTDEDADPIIKELIAQNYLNESRFARSFVGGKFRIKKWGKLKIRQEMKLKGLSKEAIKQGLEEIDGDEYEATLRDLIYKKRQSLRGEPTQIKQKLVRFAASRGFESDLIWDILKENNWSED